MNLMNRIMSYDKTKNVNQKCDCEKCVNVESENQTTEYPSLSEEEIEQIIKERYSNKDEKTKKFIRKALRKHDDRYDYSNVIYVKAIEKVEIICRVEGHKPFLQKPNNHLNGDGCPKCKGEKLSKLKKSTTKEFIEKANEVHGDKYDYSKVEYVGMKTEVIIICPKHGPFSQIPSSHLQGCGCKQCGIEKQIESQKLNTEKFIKKANEKYGEGTYDYSKVEYIDAKTDVIIICPKHGEFTQTPSNHLKGEKCRGCSNEKLANERRKPLENFINESNEIHGEGTYDYSQVNYVNSHTKVIIICSKHGNFFQKPSKHLIGQGCPKCKNNYKGEIAVRNFLIKNKIEFEEQKKFKNCKDVYSLPFDFYLPKYNLCIEFDGIQHFKPIKRSYKMTDDEIEKNFKYIQKHDQIKNDYCKNNGIILIRLNNLKTVEKELTKYFQEYGIL